MRTRDEAAAVLDDVRGRGDTRWDREQALQALLAFANGPQVEPNDGETEVGTARYVDETVWGVTAQLQPCEVVVSGPDADGEIVLLAGAETYLPRQTADALAEEILRRTRALRTTELTIPVGQAELTRLHVALTQAGYTFEHRIGVSLRLPPVAVVLVPVTVDPRQADIRQDPRRPQGW